MVREVIEQHYPDLEIPDWLIYTFRYRKFFVVSAGISKSKHEELEERAKKARNRLHRESHFFHHELWDTPFVTACWTIQRALNPNLQKAVVPVFLSAVRVFDADFLYRIGFSSTEERGSEAIRTAEYLMNLLADMLQDYVFSPAAPSWMEETEEGLFENPAYDEYSTRCLPTFGQDIRKKR
jgi:hypothetical protein